MRCISCQSLSWKLVCKNCQKNLLTSSFYKRELAEDFFVYTFYKFDEVKELLNTKYEFFGDKIYAILGSLSFKKFAQNFSYPDKVYAVAIDDHTRHQFSHTAILSKHLKSEIIHTSYNNLIAKNKVKYAGKNLEFRKNNKRDFYYKGKQNIQVILVDDLVTTGTTLLEAKEVLEKNNCEVLFALCISDANS